MADHGSSGSDWSAYAAEVGRRIASARTEAGLSQDRAAQIAGVAKYTLGLLELGKSSSETSLNPRLRTLIAVAQAIDVPVGELLPSDPPDLTRGR